MKERRSTGLEEVDSKVGVLQPMKAFVFSNVSLSKSMKNCEVVSCFWRLWHWMKRSFPNFAWLEMNVSASKCIGNREESESEVASIKRNPPIPDNRLQVELITSELIIVTDEDCTRDTDKTPP